MTPEQLRARNAAIKRAWDDPLVRALAGAKKTKPGSRSSSREAYNAYFRAYRRKKRAAKNWFVETKGGARWANHFDRRLVRESAQLTMSIIGRT